MNGHADGLKVIETRTNLLEVTEWKTFGFEKVT